MRILDTVLGHAIAIGIAVAPCLGGAQVVVMGSPVLPAPGTVMPPGSKMVRAYTIERGMPYSGVRVVQHVMIFPDGNRKEEGSSTKEWRDSEGRSRKDVTWTENDSINGVVTVCVIEDPVSLVRYIWKVATAQKTVVTETHYKMEGQVTEVWPHAPDHKIEPKPGVTIVTLRPQQNLNADSNDKTLGPEYINGVYATGTRSVEAILPGRGGNETDHPVNRVDEFWMAPDLGMVVKTFLDDGSGFTERSELKNIDRSEPELSVFLPPAGLPKREAPESDPVWSEPYGW
jgi:hypothetical protein